MWRGVVVNQLTCILQLRLADGPVIVAACHISDLAMAGWRDGCPERLPWPPFQSYLSARGRGLGRVTSPVAVLLGQALEFLHPSAGIVGSGFDVLRGRSQ